MKPRCFFAWLFAVSTCITLIASATVQSVANDLNSESHVGEPENESAADDDWSTVNDLLREMLAESRVPQSDHNIQRRKLNTKGFHAMRG